MLVAWTNNQDRTLIHVGIQKGDQKGVIFSLSSLDFKKLFPGKERLHRKVERSTGRDPCPISIECEELG